MVRLLRAAALVAVAWATWRGGAALVKADGDAPRHATLTAMDGGPGVVRVSPDGEIARSAVSTTSPATSRATTINRPTATVGSMAPTAATSLTPRPWSTSPSSPTMTVQTTAPPPVAASRPSTPISAPSLPRVTSPSTPGATTLGPAISPPAPLSSSSAEHAASTPGTSGAPSSVSARHVLITVPSTTAAELPTGTPATSGPAWTGSRTTQPPQHVSPAARAPPFPTTAAVGTPAPDPHKPTTSSSAAPPPTTTKKTSATSTPTTQPNSTNHSMVARPGSEPPSTSSALPLAPTTTTPSTFPAGATSPAPDKIVTISPTTYAPRVTTPVAKLPVTESIRPTTARPVTTKPVTSRPVPSPPPTPGPAATRPVTATSSPTTTSLANTNLNTTRPVTTIQPTSSPVSTRPASTKPPTIQPTSKSPRVPSAHSSSQSPTPRFPMTEPITITHVPQATASNPSTHRPSSTPVATKTSISPTPKPQITPTIPTKSTPAPTLKASPGPKFQDEQPHTPQPLTSTQAPSVKSPTTKSPPSNQPKTVPAPTLGPSSTSQQTTRSSAPTQTVVTAHGGESDDAKITSAQSPVSSDIPHDITVVVQNDQQKRPVITVTEDLITIDNGTNKQIYERYKRDTSQKPTVTSPTLQDKSFPSQDGSDVDAAVGPNVIVGGRNRDQIVPGADVEVSLLAHKTQIIVQSVCGGIAVAVTVLLLLFQMIALCSPRWLPRRRERHETSIMSAVLSPNAWELLVVVTYFQHIGSISMMDLTKAPQFVLDFTDSFSWTNFNVGSMETSSARRLDFTILTGMVSYADRLGIHEENLLAFTTRGFFVAVATIVIWFFLALLWRRCCSRKHNSTGERTQGFALCVLGLVAALWLVSVYPLSATSSYELRMQLKYEINGDLAIILFNLLVVVLIGTIVLIRRVQLIRPDDAMDYRYVAVFGALYAGAKRNARFFFGLFALFQTAAGVCVGAIDEGSVQLIHLLILHGGHLVSIMLVRPYHRVIVNVFVGALTALRILNLTVATLFTTTSTISTRRRGFYATTFVISNFFIVLAIFFRQFLVFIYVLRMWSTRDDVSKNPTGVNGGPDPGITNTYTIPPHLGQVDTIADITPSTDTQLTLWRASSSISDGESPVPNLANRPIVSPFRNEFVLTKK